ncbi:MAG: amidohydrolase family protein [Armatimonadetes bacterium]|nr:amidohydrolase family protein [Candidatus Hippobium faecium]
MRIDFHTHCFLDSLAERAVAKLAKNADIDPFLKGTCEDLSRSTKEAGLDYSLVCPIATKPSQARNINTWATEFPEKYKNLLCLGTMHPDMEDFREEAKFLKENGIKGIKIHPDYQLAYIDDERYMKMFAALCDYDLFLLTHAGFDVGLPKPRHCTPDRMAKVMKEYPSLKIIAAHMGGVEEIEDVYKYYIGKNIYLDTCFTHLYISGEKLAKMIKDHGADRVLFGTDSPWSDQKQQVGYIESLDLTEEEKKLVLGENAKGLLF